MTLTWQRTDSGENPRYRSPPLVRKADESGHPARFTITLDARAGKWVAHSRPDPKKYQRITIGEATSLVAAKKLVQEYVDRLGLSTNPRKPARRRKVPARRRRNPESMSEEAASTLLRQLGGTSRLSAMIGATGFIRTTKDGNSALGFKFKGSKNANYVLIALDPSDTYSLYFGKLGKYELKPVREFHEVYVGSLRPTFENFTQLRLSL